MRAVLLVTLLQSFEIFAPEHRENRRADDLQRALSAGTRAYGSRTGFVREVDRELTWMRTGQLPVLPVAMRREITRGVWGSSRNGFRSSIAAS